MTVAYVNSELDMVRKYAKTEPEKARGIMEELHFAVLLSIAEGVDNPEELASCVVESASIEIGEGYAP